MTARSLQADPTSWAQACRAKWIDPGELVTHFRGKWRRGKTVVSLNGCFDILHVGHLHVLYEAAKQGDWLVVALNSDRSVSALKGAGRPYVPLEERMEMVAGFACVDYVTFFEEGDPRSLLAQICPDLHVTGSEYGVNCVEAEVVERCGGRLVLIDRLGRFSTTGLVERIRACD